MKLVFMTYYVGMHQEVMEILAACGIASYTHWDEVTGRLSCGEPREGSDVWPGYNTALQAVLREETAKKLEAAILEHNAAQRGDERIDACFLETHSVIRAADEFNDCSSGQ
ncbi:MAG: PG0541 family transporter-associated protein [Candidatus Eisenbacteria bacterium]